MTLKSMTGFARTDATRGSTSWAWEIKSVNGRSLDVRLRVPPGFDALEPKIRELVAKRVSRGSISVNLTVKRAEGVSEIRLNEAALAQAIAAADRVRAITKGPAATTEGLLALRGVLEFVEAIESETEAEARTAAMLASFQTALAGLVAGRAAEGGHLCGILADQLTEIERLVAAVTASPARTPDATRRRLQEMLARILDVGVRSGAGAPASGGCTTRDARRHRGGTEASDCAHRGSARTARSERAGRAQTRFSRPGVQPRG